MALAEAFADDERPWLLRRFDPALDSDMISLLSGSYCRSSAGKRQGASGFPEADAAGQERRRAYQRKMRPVWEWLMAHADILLAVDPESPETSIWGWLVTSGPEVIHAIGCKRSAIAAGLCRDLVLDLLGERWTTSQVVTLELPQMRQHRTGWAAPKDWFGFDRPTKWHLDPMWLPAEMESER